MKISLGEKFPESIIIWSDKNELSPFDYSYGTNKKVWWKCENNIHDDYERIICNQTNYGFKCPECKKMTIRKYNDLTNRKFGRLTVTSYDEDDSKKHKQSYWFCDCECGTKHKSVYSRHLLTGKIQSCGCLWKESITGENHYNWKNGITSEREKQRGSFEHKNWAKEIYKKCWYTCQCCGKSGNFKKNAHHIINFAENEDKKYDVSNGILLCEECHSHTYNDSFHSVYGNKNNNETQLEQYINYKRNKLGINILFKISDYFNGYILKPGVV